MGKHSRKDHRPTDRSRTLSTKSRYFENAPGSLQILKDRAYLVQVNGERTRIELPEQFRNRPQGVSNAPKEGEIVFLDDPTEPTRNNPTTGVNEAAPPTN